MRASLATLREALLDATAVLLPVDCAGCGAADRALCSGCRRALAAGDHRHPLADGTPVHSALLYEAQVRAAILAFKELGRTDIARALSVPLARTLHRVAAHTGPVELVVVPTTRAAWRRRGYDPVPLLLAQARLRPARVLRRVRATGTQKALGTVARSANRAGSLAARSSLLGRRFIAVDDVMTTGATLDEVVRAVTEAGGEVVAGVTLAYTPRLFAPSS